MDEMFYIPTETEMKQESRTPESDHLRVIAEKLDTLNSSVSNIEAPSQPVYQPQYVPQQPAEEAAFVPEGVAIDVAKDGTPYIKTENLKQLNDYLLKDEIDGLRKKQNELEYTIASKNQQEAYNIVYNTVAGEFARRGVQGEAAGSLTDMAIAQYNYANFRPDISDPEARMSAAIDHISGFTAPIYQDVLPISNGMGMHQAPRSVNSMPDPRYKVNSDETIVVRAPGPGKNRDEFVRINSEISELYNRFEREGKPVPNIVYSDANLYSTKDPNEIKMYLENQHGKGVRYITNPLRQLNQLH
jgi:hypothetical protein